MYSPPVTPAAPLTPEAAFSANLNVVTMPEHQINRAAPSANGAAQVLRQTTASALLALALVGTLNAQSTTATTTDQPVVMDDFVVSGIRSSLAASLDEKRKASGIVDVITAEDVGKFPDTNVAESLSHLPGITVDRLFGQGERVSILGTDPLLNRTLLGGQSVASADWFILDTPGRTFNYTLLAPEIVGRVEVYRTPEARHEEGSVGGTVNVHLRNPLEMKPLSFSGSVGYLYNHRHEDGEPNYSAMFSWRNPEKTVGFAVSAQYQNEHIRRDGIESYGTVPATEYAGYRNATLLANPTARGPNAIGTAFFNQDRERTSFTASLAFKPSKQVEFSVDALRVEAEYNNVNQSLYLFPARPWDTDQTVTSATVSNGIITNLTMGNAISVLDVQYREAKVETDSITGRAAFHGDNWNLSGQIGTTEATGGTQRQLFGEFLNRGAYTYDISGAPGAPGTISWANATTSSSGAAWVTDPGWGGNLVSKPTSDEESYAQADFDYSLGNETFKKLRFGVKYRKHETAQDMFGWALTGVAWPATMFNATVTPGNYLEGIGGANDQMRRRIAINGDTMAAAIAARNLDRAPRGDFFNEIWSVREWITGAYGQADFSVDQLSGNIGVRFVDNDSTSRGNVANPAGVFTPVSRSKSWSKLLPSLNTTYEVAQNTLIRFGASQVVARPNYADMTPYTALNDTVRTGDGGNPNLDPYKSTNFDLSAEWYLGRDSIIAATLFYKDIGNYILRSTAAEQHFDVTNRTQNITYQVSRPRNAGSAESKGFALQFQRTLGAGFGIMANYTYADAEGERGAELPFNSKHQLNVSPFFENKAFTARVTVAWRDKYFTGIDRGDMMYTAEYTDVAASLAYRINKNFTVSLEGMNLLDEEYFSYANTERMPRGVYKNGERFLASVRFNY